MKRYIKIVLLLIILLCFSFTINRCYATSTKEEVDNFRKAKDIFLEKELKRWKNKYRKMEYWWIYIYR